MIRMVILIWKIEKFKYQYLNNNYHDTNIFKPRKRITRDRVPHRPNNNKGGFKGKPRSGGYKGKNPRNQNKQVELSAEDYYWSSAEKPFIFK